MSKEESISLEETNKIRISLGLKPLTDDGVPADNKEKEAENNYAKQREKDAKERESKKIRDKIAKVRNRQELNASLKGATLGDADGDDDTLKWIKKSKKREKELARKRLEELDSMDRAFQGEGYSERDLAGLKVSHDFDEMDEGEARILTLKDSRILDNEEDELQNIEMAEDERTKKNNELRIKKRDYTGYDDDEFNPGMAGVKRSVLSKYDKVLEGDAESGFRLGSSSSSQSKSAKDAAKEKQTAAAVNKSLLTIDYDKNLESGDYLKEGDVGFKKPKTKKKRPSRRTAVEEPDGEVMDVDEKPAVRERNLDTNFVDDDDLQAALARSRRAKIHKTKKMTPEELARKIAEEREREASQAAVKAEVQEDDGAGGLTFDDTSEFIRAVGTGPVVEKKAPKVKTERADSAARDVEMAAAPRSPSRDVSLVLGDVALDEMEAGEVQIKEEENADEAMALLDEIERALKSEELNVKNEQEDIGVGGTGSEQTFRSGMASTLNLLRQQGILAAPSADQKDRERTQLQRDLWLADQRRRIAQTELDRIKARGSNKDQATREYENRVREQREARESLEAFKDYKPDVNIVYYDEHGRTLTPKEAWKALSHKFHGKGSGKGKTEKKLKKIAEEKRQEAMASGDTPLSMQKAFQMRQEKTGQAHFVLSVGNRGAVPQAAGYLDAQPLSKKSDKSKKKKEGKKANGEHSSGFMTVPAPQIGTISGEGTPNGSPAPKAGFSRITSATVESVPSPSGTGTPGPSDRSKVAFGFGTKRKAENEILEGTPPPKRR